MSLFLNTLSGIVAPTPPIWLMRQAGRYLPEYRAIRAQCPDFLSLCYTPKLATEVTLQPIRRFDFDAAILFSDILVVPDALGIKTWFEEGHGPKLVPLKQGEILSFKNLDKILSVYQAVNDIRSALPQDKALIGFSGAPWTLMTYIAAGTGGDKQKAALNWLITDPETFHINMDILCEAIAAHCILQIEAGAHVIQLFDSWAHVLEEENLNKCSVEPLCKIITRIKNKYPKTPILLFPRGISENSIQFFSKIGANVISINEDIQLKNVIHKYPIIFQGNLKPEILLQDAQTIIDSTQSIIDSAAGKPFIFNLGHGILPTTPIENVHTLINTIRG